MGALGPFDRLRRREGERSVPEVLIGAGARSRASLLRRDGKLRRVGPAGAFDEVFSYVMP
jgi:hypothetical protein